MDLKKYIYATVICLGNWHKFFELSIGMKWRYIFLHFILIVCLLFFPVSFTIVKTQPDALYTRMFSQNFESSSINIYNDDNYSQNRINSSEPAIYVFGDLVVYSDSLLVISAPSEFFDSETLAKPFGEVFSMIAVYNMYIPQFLLPLLIIAFIVLLAIQVFFYILCAIFLGTYRMMSKQFTFFKNIKIVIMGSFFPSILCVFIGFILPAIHIILFQMINLFLIFFISKKYDKKERELLICEEQF